MSRRAPSLLALVAAFAAGCLGVTTDSLAPIDLSNPGTWAVLTPVPTPRQEVAVAALDGRIFVIGGFGAGAQPVATVEAYDPEANRWAPRASLPVAVHHPAAAVVNGRLFVIGGYTGGRIRWTASQLVFEYEATRNAWTTRMPMPTPRGALAVAVLNGRIHALGGSAEALFQTHEVYDPATDRWSLANPMPTARDHLAAVSFDGRVWALGGRAAFAGTQYDNVEVYDPASDSWRTAPPLPRARGGLAAVALPDRILVFGGEAPLRIFNATEMYEPAGHRWIAKAPMPTPRHGIGAAVLGERVYVPAGGRRPGYAPTGANEAYTP